MINDILNRKTNLQVALKTLDANMLRLKATANNIANVSTPGYKRVEVGFEEELKRALDRTRLKGEMTQKGHIPLGRLDIASVNPRAFKPIDPTVPSGVNNVDIDTEMAKLAESQLAFTMGARFLKGVYNKINAAIQQKPLQIQ